MMAAWKSAPALAMGNTLVLKPASYTPLTALEIAESPPSAACRPACSTWSRARARGGRGAVHQPPGRQDLVHRLHRDRPARDELAAGNVKKVTLELGGKSPTIVCDDADMDMAVDGALFGTFFHGQLCESGSAASARSRSYDAFIERDLERVQLIKVGDTPDFETTWAP